RRYIEEEIPHIASIMCETVEAVTGHAEVLVIGSTSDEAVGALASVRPGQVVVDLTRGAVTRSLVRRRGPEEAVKSQAAV
ncbi:MAG TPA: hypothetical protein VJO72_10895, partial [Candidatus Dormibacteraeota bacterium]|nr:hypothetical protein [Candidatus Dormibacteraeota bacterium]